MMPASDTAGKIDQGCPAEDLEGVGRGAEWIVDADLKDFFGSVDHEKLLTLVAQRISDGRVLRLIERMLKAASSPRASASRPSRVPLRAGSFPPC